MKEYTDTEIIASIQSGSSNEVLVYLYKTVQPKIKSWVLQNSGDIDEAQDIFQDAVIAFHNYVVAGKFKEGNSVDGFIFSIGKNLWINRAKQKNKLVRNIENQENKAVGQIDFFEKTASEEKTKYIQELLSQLGERCKELLTYSIFYKMSMEEISVKMGFSNADVAKTKNYKCKQRLIALVKEHTYIKELMQS